MINSQSFTKRLKFTSCELGPIVTDNNSGTPKRANNSVRKYFFTEAVGLLHLKISGHLEWLSTTIK